MQELLLFGVRSPLTPDYEETCVRLGIRIVAAVQVDDQSPRLLDRSTLTALADLTEACRQAPYVTCAFNPARRSSLASLADNAGLQPADALIDPTAIVAGSVKLGRGSYINAGAILGSVGFLGDHIVINRAVSLGHHVVIGDFVSLGPGVTVTGNVWIGENSVIGAGAVLLPGIRVGANVIVAAGSVVRHDIADDTLVAGNPAVEKSRPPRLSAISEDDQE